MLQYQNAGSPPPFVLLPPPAQPEPGPFEWIPGALAFVRRRFLFIAWFALAGIALGVAVLAQATPQYTAVASIMIDSRRSHPVRAATISTDARSEDVFLESLSQVLRAPSTARAVVERLGLDTDPRFMPPAKPGLMDRLREVVRGLVPADPGAPAPADPRAAARMAAARQLEGMLDVRRIGGTAVVDIKVTSADRALSAELANAYTQVFIDRQLDQHSDITRRGGDWLQSRIAELRDQMIAADRAVQEYKAANNIVDVGTGLLNEQALAELNARISTAAARVAETQARLDRVTQVTANGIINGTMAEALQNPVMTRLRQQYLDASRREAEVAARFGASHGAAVNLRNEMTELQRVIQSELARITETHLSDFEVARANLRAMEERLATIVATTANLNLERSMLRSLQSSADAYRNIFENFLLRYNQAMQDQSYPLSDARVVSEAEPPQGRSSPRTMVVLLAGMMLGLVAGVCAAILREALDNTVRMLGHLRAATGLPILGIVPRERRLRRRAHKVGLPAVAGAQRMDLPARWRVAVTMPDSGIAGAVRAARVAAARQTAQGSEVRVFGCTSAMHREGTTTFAANLAAGFAASGKRTLLLDWHGSTDGLSAVLAPRAERGLAAFATGQAPLSDLVLTDATTGLMFLPLSRMEGQQVGVPAREALTRLREEAEVIVIDLPPLVPDGTALALSDLIDGFILLSRWGFTPRSLVTEAINRASPLDALFLGVVLNDCDMRRMRLYPQAGIAGPMPKLAMAGS